MRTGGTLAVLVAAAALALSGCSSDEPSTDEVYADLVSNADLPTNEQLDSLIAQRDKCIGGSNGSCNILWTMAIARDPGATFLEIAGICGGRRDEPFIPAHEMDFPCEVG